MVSYGSMFPTWNSKKGDCDFNSERNSQKCEILRWRNAAILVIFFPLNYVVITRSFLVITRSFLVITRSFLVITRSFLVITRSFLVITRSFLVITTCVVIIDMVELRAAQSDINEDLHAAELKYTVLNVFNVIVLIIAACLLWLMSNTTLSNNSTQTHDLFRLYMIRSKQLFLNNWLWAWNIYLLNDWSLIEQQIEIWTKINKEIFS